MIYHRFSEIGDTSQQAKAYGGHPYACYHFASTFTSYNYKSTYSLEC